MQRSDHNGNSNNNDNNNNKHNNNFNNNININKNFQNFSYQQSCPSSDRLIKGITRDIILKQLKQTPLLMSYYLKNTPQIQQRIIDTLMRYPSSSDCPGFIYGFRQYNQYKSNPFASTYQIKMGRTKRQIPQDRIFQWQKDDQHKYVEIFTIRTENNYKLQALIHLFFAYARKIKYVNGKRRIEWFTFEEKAVNSVVTGLVNEVMEKMHKIGECNQSRIKQKENNKINIKENIKQLMRFIGNQQMSVKKCVLVGLKNSGKSVLKAMLSGLKISLVNQQPQSSNPLSILLSNNSLQQNFSFSINPQSLSCITSILQLSRRFPVPSPSLQTSLTLLLQNFSLWYSLYNTSTQPIPCFIVKLNDILSCQMIGFRQGLKWFIKYIKVCRNKKQKNKNYGQSINYDENEEGYYDEELEREINDWNMCINVLKRMKLVVVVTHVMYNEDKLKIIQAIRMHFMQNLQYFTQIQLQIILNSFIQISYLPHNNNNNNNNNNKQLNPSYQYNIKSLISQIQQYQFPYNYIQQQQNKNFQYSQYSEYSLTFEYQINIQKSTQIISICEQIVNNQYEQIGDKLEEYFKDTLRDNIKEFEKKKENQRIKRYENFNEELIKQEQEIISVENQMDVIMNKLNFVQNVNDNVRRLKYAKKQQQVFHQTQRLFNILRKNQTQSCKQDKLLIRLLIFCECMKKNDYMLTDVNNQNNNNNNINNNLSSQQKNKSLSSYHNILTSSYLSSTLLFKPLQFYLSQQRLQLRDCINSLIQSCLKQIFQSSLKQFYQSLYDNNFERLQENKIIFDSVYNVLFKIMSIQQQMIIMMNKKELVTQNEKKKYQEDILMKLLKQLIELAEKNNMKYCRKFQLVRKVIRFFYFVNNQKRIKLVNLMARVREVIYMATKNKKVVQIQKKKKQQKQNKIHHLHLQKQQQHIVIKHQKYSKKKVQHNKNVNINNNISINSHNISIQNTSFSQNQFPKVIHNKNSTKNQKLLNFIQNQRQLQQQRIKYQQNQQSFQQQSSQSLQRNIILNQVQIDQKIVLSSDNEDDFKQKDEYFSIPDQNQNKDEEDFSYLDEKQTMIERKNNNDENGYYTRSKDKIEINNKNKKISKDIIDNNDKSTDNHYIQFVDSIISSINTLSISSNPSSLFHTFSSLSQLSSSILSILISQNLFTQQIFNYHPNCFLFNTSIQLHSSLIIFAKKIVFSQLLLKQFPQLRFKIHYHNRRAYKINLILLAEEYQNVGMLKIEENKYGKVLCVKINDNSKDINNNINKKYEVLEGYYTKNYKTKAKVQQLKVKQLVEAYFKIIK